ncbi:hypothetical protein LL912_00765 [Niabella sp. CC-SYL272]|uniref:hypothetical protein n=1 Tax=Niabella agricola TaxID=2891571 RepID=UPI001F185E61|nr:hypothetical protein [Niabella agricola]MCF3107298.1 hypothetical protein [Niabella agricola]
MKYGAKPLVVGHFSIDCKEMMFYQDMLIKLPGGSDIHVEDRLKVFSDIIGAAACHFVGASGLNAYIDSSVYLSAKRLFQAKGKPFNRPGWHSDGFMSDDINYIWSDDGSTVFNFSDFNLTQDDKLSMQEMAEQALPEFDWTYSAGTLLRLDQYNIHRVGDVERDGMRTFVKVSFSKNKFDLEGNAHNYLIDYDWEMRPRGIDRNIPQKVK